MATPEELRERLRAKRDAQLQHQQHCDAVRAQARQAVQDLIILGYNFPQILELTNGEVSAEHLDAHYKAIGYFRRKEPAASSLPQRDLPRDSQRGSQREMQRELHRHPQNAFGAPRWLNNVKNYTISLEDSEPESASEDEADSRDAPEVGAPPESVNSLTATNQADTDMPDANTEPQQLERPAFTHAHGSSDANEGTLSLPDRDPPSGGSREPLIARSDSTGEPSSAGLTGSGSHLPTVAPNVSTDSHIAPPSNVQPVSVSNSAAVSSSPEPGQFGTLASATASAPTGTEPSNEPVSLETSTVPNHVEASTAPIAAASTVSAASNPATDSTNAYAAAGDSTTASAPTLAAGAATQQGSASEKVFTRSSPPNHGPASAHHNGAVPADTGVLPRTEAQTHDGLRNYGSDVQPPTAQPGRDSSEDMEFEDAQPPHTQAEHGTSEDMEFQDALPNTERDASEDVEFKDAPIDSTTQRTPTEASADTHLALESGDSQAGLGSSAVSQAGPDDSADSSSEDDAPTVDEVSIQEELRKVQEQVRAMQERKHIKEVQREAEAAIQKRTAELSGIAAKRAVLMQARHKLNLPKLTSRVSRLESKLKSAKEVVLNAAVQLKDINAQSLELEKKEIRIRNELARPATPREHAEHTQARMLAPAPNEAAATTAEVVEGSTSVSEAAEADAKEARPPVKVLTAADSPLRMFGSWRLAPLGPRHWFSPSFNGRFVKDLDVREFCNVDLTGETCVDRDCEFVHYRDFEVPPSLVVEYMATRGIDRPGFKDGLVQAVRTHLTGPEASPEQLAAAVVGFRQQYDATQILDWDSWGVTRPM